jgi:hypothetical protein
MHACVYMCVSVCVCVCVCVRAKACMHAYMYEHETLSTPHRSLSQVYRLLTRTISHDPNDRMTGHPLVTLAYAVERFDSVCTFAASLLYKTFIETYFHLLTCLKTTDNDNHSHIVV